ASAVPIVVLGLVLGTYLGEQIRTRDVSSAVRAVEMATRLGVTPQLRMRSGALHVSRQETADLDRALRHGDAVGGQIARIQIWSQAKRVVYSDDHRLIGHGAVGPPSEELLAALRGTVGTETLSAAHRLTRERESQGLL